MLSSLEARHSLVSYCALNDLTDFKLDPPKGKGIQAALVEIVSVLDTTPTTFLTQSVQLLRSDEAENLADHFKRFIFFTALTKLS